MHNHGTQNICACQKARWNGPGRCRGEMNRVRDPSPVTSASFFLAGGNVQSCVFVNKESMLSAHVLCRTGAAKTKLSCQMIVSRCVNQVEAFHKTINGIYIVFILYQICLSGCDRDLLKLASQREEDVDQCNLEDQWMTRLQEKLDQGLRVMASGLFLCLSLWLNSTLLSLTSGSGRFFLQQLWDYLSLGVSEPS